MLKSIISRCLMIAWLSSGIAAMAQTAIGGTSPDQSAMLDVQSNEKGLLIPRMSTDERMLINSPANGLIIFNTTENRLQVNQGTPGNASWHSFFVPGKVTALNCNSATITGTLFDGLVIDLNSPVTATVPYTGSNGGEYFGQVVYSRGIAGLVAILPPGNFNLNSGNLVFNVFGTPSGIGIAEFHFIIGGQYCVLSVPVTT